MLAIDHVVYAARDLDDAAERFRRDHGLSSVAGGRHPGWGTGNRIVPLGASYVEIISVLDRVEAGASSFGRSLLARLDAGDGWFTLALAAEDLEGFAAAAGLAVTRGERSRPDGSVLRWRTAGFDDPRREPWMPFFIAWDVPPAFHPGRTPAGHALRARGISRVEVGDDGGRLAEWLGGEAAPITVTDGPPGILAVAIATADGELILR